MSSRLGMGACAGRDTVFLFWLGPLFRVQPIRISGPARTSVFTWSTGRRRTAASRSDHRPRDPRLRHRRTGSGLLLASLVPTSASIPLFQIVGLFAQARAAAVRASSSGGFPPTASAIQQENTAVVATRRRRRTSMRRGRSSTPPIPSRTNANPWVDPRIFFWVSLPGCMPDLLRGLRNGASARPGG